MIKNVSLIRSMAYLSMVLSRKNKKFNKGRRYGGPLFIFGCLEV